jgi:dihydroorotate dehydrogenase electron transfer subunit
MHVLSLRLPSSFPNAAAGTFVMLSVGAEPDILLRRPMALYDVRKKRGAVLLDILYAAVGVGTRHMRGLKRGAELSLFGPIGNSFSKPTSKERVTVVAGGVGIAPFLLWARQLNATERKNAQILLGFRNRSQLPVARPFRRTGLRPLCAVEGPGGDFRGTVVDLLERELAGRRPGRILTCGPEKMMDRVLGVARRYRIPVEASLEVKMGCGIGVCLSCVTPRPESEGRGGFALVCQDGPIFLTH